MSAAGSGAGSRILVVDDSEDNRYTLVRRLRREGYADLVEARNGREALERLAAQAFDLVLLDVMMPEMNGYEVLERLKADMALRHIPVIMISAVDELDSVVRCIQTGAEDYLGKPFNATLLKARVEACLEKKRLRDLEASHMRSLEAERRRADALLHAILPAGAVKELKATDRVVPRRYEDVAVLFCDIVGFTPYCDRNPPERVVAELQAMVTAFEGIVESRGLEKIKTIGDAFLATGGLLRHIDEPLLACVACGQDMIAAAAAQEPHWRLRVGVHPGPVVAGIVGHRQYLFDLWGDTVNTAARITARARPGTVVVTASTWLELRDRCHGVSRGTVDLKGKGLIELVECRALHAAAGEGLAGTG